MSFAEQKATASGSPAEHAFLYHDHWPYGAVLTLPPATFGSAVFESATLSIPAQYATIQAAVNATQSGDTVGSTGPLAHHLGLVAALDLVELTPDHRLIGLVPEVPVSSPGW